MSSQNKNRSFTLIELLVVIAIIGLLAAVAVASLNNAMVRARDAKRIGDISQITKAIELSYNFNNSYPIPTGNTTKCLSDCTPSNWCANLVTQMPNIPNDPLPTQQCYLYNSDGTNFRIAAKLESASNYAIAQNDGGLYPSFYEGYSSPSSMLLSAYKSVWPSNGLTQLDPNYNNLVGWWDFEEGTGGAGASTADFSSSANNGTLSATPPTWQTSGCQSGGCLNFDGSSNYVTTPDIQFTINQPWSFSMWQEVATSRSWAAFLGSSIGGNLGGYWMWQSSGISWYQDYYNSTPYDYSPSAPRLGTDFPYNVWNNITVINTPVDGTHTNITIYVNGILKSTGSVLWSPRPVLYFTFRWLGMGDGIRFFQGLIDDVRVYNIALTANQICHLCKEKKSASFCNNCSE
jgi:prepilin-type N-terminal cleavage/methylation domain-containing protein